VVLVAVPAAGSPRPGAAGAITEPGLVSEQLVTSTLDASGLPVTSTLTTQVVARDQERGDVLVPTSTKDLRYLDRRGAPPTEGDAAVVALGGPGTSAALLGSSFARPLPVALHAEYRRDGATVDPAALEGAGDLTIVYTATNTVVTEQTIAYADAAGERRSSVQRVFAPFAGTLAVALPAGASVRSAPGAVVGTGADGGTFVAWDLVLYPPIGAPQRQMVLELSSPAAEAAARDLEAAVGEIADAVGSSPDPPITLPPSGTPTLVQLSRASGAAAAALRTTTLGVSSALGAIATQLVTVQGDATSAATSVSGVYAAACQPAPSALSVAQCAALQDAVTDATAAATGAGAAAAAVGTQAATLTATAQGLVGLAGALTALTDGLLEVSAALRSGDAAAPGVAEGLAALADGLTSSVTAVTRLAVGATDSSAGAEALATGTEQLATGLEDTSTGAEQLAAGGEQIAEGAEGFATGVDGVAEGSAELASGASTAEEGSASVTDGATSLAEEGTSVTLDSVVEASADPALARAYLEAASDAAGTSAPYAAPEGGVARVAYVSEIPAVPAPAGALDPVVLGMALLVGATAVAVVVLARRRIRRVAAAE
jgi:putative membrane protein